MTKNRNIQFGCAWSAPKNWRNFDCSPTLRFERIPIIGKLYTKNKNRFPVNVEYGDIVKGLPLSSNSCDYVYCSHVLEHLSLNDCRKALKNTYTILKDGGIFRLVLPDMEYCAKEYINNPNITALEFMQSLDIGSEERYRSIFSFIYDYFQNSKHYWMWDYLSLEAELKQVGFIKIRRAHIGDSNSEVFDTVEEYDRWENCLGIQCVK